MTDLVSYWKSNSLFPKVKMLPELPLPALEIYIYLDDIRVISEELISILKINCNGKIYKEGDKIMVYHFGKNCMIKILKITSHFYSKGMSNSFIILDNSLWKLNLQQCNSQEVKKSKKKITHFGGYENILHKIKTIIQFSLYDPLKQNTINSRGIIIHGLNGAGKTSLVEKIANDSQAFTTFIKGSELITKFYGDTEQKIKEIFIKATNKSPSIIIIDDLELLCPNQINNITDQNKRILSTLLTHLDKRDCKKPIIVLATTTRIEDIHPSLQRSGRFDQEIELESPNFQDRFKILKADLLNYRHSISDEDLMEIAINTHGFVAADLTLLCSKAKFYADENDYSRPITITIKELKMSLDIVKPSAMLEVLIQVPKVKWSDIAGQEIIKETMKQAILWPMKYPDYLSRHGLKSPKGILMFGPPGCSKTMIAKAIATETKLNFLSIKCSELFSKWFGESERAIRELFKRARQVAPSIVFLDELDAFAGQRTSSHQGGCDVQGRVATQLLTEIDGIESLNKVIVIGATNRPDLIDPALLRPGRLGKTIYVPLPDDETREKIFLLKFKSMPISDEVLTNLDNLVKLTKGFSGAEVNNLCQHAGYLSLEENIENSSIDLRHFYQSLDTLSPKTPQYLNDIYLHFIRK